MANKLSLISVLLTTLVYGGEKEIPYIFPIDNEPPPMVGFFAERAAAAAGEAYPKLLKARRSDLVGKPVTAVVESSREIGIMAVDPTYWVYGVELQVYELTKGGAGSGYTRWNWTPRGNMHFSVIVSDRLTTRWTGCKPVAIDTIWRETTKMSDQERQMATLALKHLGYQQSKILKSKVIDKDTYEVEFRRDGMDLTYSVKLDPTEVKLLESTVE